MNSRANSKIVFAFGLVKNAFHHTRTSQYLRSPANGTSVLAMRNLLLLLLISGFFLPGCGYPKVSRSTYEISIALYSATNRKDEVGLQKAADLINAKQSQGELSTKEADWLLQIVDQAESGDWQGAATQARKLMDDQVTF